jgi:uncharacterized iron-regulated membrane protein
LSPGRRLRVWLRFAHTGEVYGLAGQAVAGLASLGGATLVVTGLMLAGRRLLAWRARARSIARAAAPSRAYTRIERPTLDSE